MYSFILFILKGFRLDYGKIPQPLGVCIISTGG
jgi:hypothetical protein